MPMEGATSGKGAEVPQQYLEAMDARTGGAVAAMSRSNVANRRPSDVYTQG